MFPNRPPPAWPEALRDAEALYCRLVRSAWAMLATSALLLAACDGVRDRREAVKQPPGRRPTQEN